MISSVYKMNMLNAEFESNKVDYFLVAGGSDYRAYEVLKKFNTSKVDLGNIIFFNFDERTKDLEANDSYHDYSKVGYSINCLIDCSLKAPSSSLPQLDPVLSGIAPESKVAIDISCFTKPFFFFLVKLLSEKYKVSTIEVYYTEPESYVFPRGLFNSYHSSSGPLTVKEIPGFTGIETRNDKRILVILLGFDGDLSQEINEDVSPSKTVLVNGFPGYAPKFKDISLVINEKLTSNKDFRIHYARANNPFEVYNLLDKIKKENVKSFINIAPLGTKPMALGACLFAIHNPSVRIVYPIPEEYEKTTTRNCLHSWRYEIPILSS
jgi:hypothetical protein